MFRRRVRREPSEPAPVASDEPRYPDPSKYEVRSGPRAYELKQRGLLDLEDYIPDENGNTRRRS